MEPASTLAVVALAAATIVPPFIEVRLGNWENKTKKSFEFCKTKKTSCFPKVVEKPPVAQLDTGCKNVDALIYSETNPPLVSAVRILDSNARYDLDLMLQYYSHYGFQVSCVHRVSKM